MQLVKQSDLQNFNLFLKTSVFSILGATLIRSIEAWRECLNKDFVIDADLTDLSKAFDCVLHGLLITNLEAYRLGEKALSYIYL